MKRGCTLLWFIHQVPHFASRDIKGAIWNIDDAGMTEVHALATRHSGFIARRNNDSSDTGRFKYDQWVDVAWSILKLLA